MPHRRTIAVLAFIVVLAAAVGTGVYVNYLGEHRADINHRLDAICWRQNEGLTVLSTMARRMGDNDAAEAFKRIRSRPCEKRG